MPHALLSRCADKRDLAALRLTHFSSVHKQVVIFAKAPKLGTVKTRLAVGIGDVAATALYRNWSGAVIRRIARDSRWQTSIAVSPDQEAGNTRSWPLVWPDLVRRIPQGTGDLGQRMAKCFRVGAPGPVLIVGSDIPDLESRHIAAAFEMLGSNDAVFGPADDGGYWLIGFSMRMRRRVTLADVRWSSEHALGDTIAGLGAGCKVGMLTERLADIDTVEDLDAWRASREFRS